MTGTSHDRTQAPVSQYGTTADTEATAWAGWVAFAGFMLMLGSFFQVIMGLVALFNNHYYVARPSGMVVNVSYTTWGWFHIILGVVAGLTGLGLLAGNIVARWVGVIIAGVLAIVNFVFIPAYPIWGLMLVTIDVLVIYAIIAHGRELKSV